MVFVLAVMTIRVRKVMVYGWQGSVGKQHAA